MKMNTIISDSTEYRFYDLEFNLIASHKTTNAKKNDFFNHLDLDKIQTIDFEDSEKEKK